MATKDEREAEKETLVGFFSTWGIMVGAVECEVINAIADYVLEQKRQAYDEGLNLGRKQGRIFILKKVVEGMSVDNAKGALELAKALRKPVEFEAIERKEEGIIKL